MMGVPEPPPGENIVLVLAWVFAVVLCIGALTAPAWGVAPARIVRWAAIAVAVLVQVGFHIMAPPRSAMESAGRFVFLWPALLVALIAAGVWHWRDSSRSPRADDVTNRVISVGGQRRAHGSTQAD